MVHTAHPAIHHNIDRNQALYIRPSTNADGIVMMVNIAIHGQSRNGVEQLQPRNG
jgi:hypothetical protein